MASWDFASQLILISLLGWNVYCYPPKSWNQHNPDEGSSSRVVNVGLQNAPYPAIYPRTSKPAQTVWVVARPQRKNLPGSPLNPQVPAVSQVVDVPQKKVTFLDPEGPTNWVAQPPKRAFPNPPSNPQAPTPWVANHSPQNLPDAASNPRESWMAGKENPVVYTPASSSTLGALPVEDPTPAQFGSGNSQSGPGINVSPVYQPGDLHHFQAGLDQGNSNSETRQVMDSVVPPPFPPPPPSIYQGGALTTSSSLYEHGNFEHETEDDSFMPVPPYAPGELQSSFSSGPVPPAIPNLFYLFLTGQLPHGTVTHVQSDYETSKDRSSQIGYDTYHFSSSANSDPIQTQAPSDWDQVQGFW
ncbi:uncharacterized protein PAE49_011848 [Odontesthes bonariensis]|uniref:uncharacterized protein LOC142395991 n=1 Tax=Odontesthes bonariensis TaxID=219752 RepID=UPI003F58B546